jgi:hypothetical protein
MGSRFKHISSRAVFYTPPLPFQKFKITTISKLHITQTNLSPVQTNRRSTPTKPKTVPQHLNVLPNIYSERTELEEIHLSAK